MSTGSRATRGSSAALVTVTEYHADLLIRAGVMPADTTTGGFTHGYDPEPAGIDLGPAAASVDGKTYEGVPLAAALAGLTRLGSLRRRRPGRRSRP